MTLGIVFIVLGALPFLAVAAWLYLDEVVLVLLAVASFAVVLGAVWSIGHGIELVLR